MGFELRQDTRKWFKEIEKDYSTLFDIYYLCLIPGFITKSRNTEIHSDSVDEITRYFPDAFRSRGQLLIVLLIDTELSRLGINLSERKTVYSRISELVVTTPPYISDAGIKLMNQYAHGGFDILTENISERPRSIETFVRKYYSLIQTLSHDLHDR